MLWISVSVPFEKYYKTNITAINKFCYSLPCPKFTSITLKLTGGKSEKGISFEMRTLFMLKVIENEILPEIKRVVNSERRITLVFDREGWSPNSFQRWDKKGFDILTYRKGNYDPWPLDNFIEVEKVICGNIVKYSLGQRSIKLSNGMWVREIRRLCKNGHQTSIITTLQKPCFVELAYRMFFRWSQWRRLGTSMLL
jgi:hypothetical protein